MKTVPHVQPTMSSLSEYILKYLQISKKKTQTTQLQSGQETWTIMSQNEKVLNLISKEKAN